MVNDLVEVTHRTATAGKCGLHTKLFFSEPMNTKKGIVFSVSIDTCIVSGSTQAPYETIANDEKGNKIESIRCTSEDYIDCHFKIVDKYKKMAL